MARTQGLSWLAWQLPLFRYSINDSYSVRFPTKRGDKIVLGGSPPPVLWPLERGFASLDLLAAEIHFVDQPALAADQAIGKANQLTVAQGGFQGLQSLGHERRV